MTSHAFTSVADAAQTRKRVMTIEQRQRLWGWIFLSPWIIGFLIFTAFPMLASLIFSFTDFKLGQSITFLSESPSCRAQYTALECLFQNWANLFRDPITFRSLEVTFRFMLFAVPVGIAFPLFLAAILNSKLVYGKPILRVLFYLPYMIPAISGIFIWQSFLNGQTGWLNRLLRLIGIAEPPNWIFDNAYINTALVLIGLWGVGNAMLTMMAGMQGVPTELYEAARVDGANGFVLIWKITLPMISPVIFYNLVLSVIGLMQYFIVPFVLSNTTRSNPATNFFNLHLYKTAFQYQDMGFASTQAWFIFLIALVITIILFSTSRRWVYYAGGN
jgi:multiple sugar transport system permease protein